MTLEEKITKVEAFYAALDLDLKAYQVKSGLACVGGCSACCQSPTVEATVLELLPFAFHLYKENKAEAFYDALQENNASICALFNPMNTLIEKGGCSSYQYRALICRLFGFSYTRDKVGHPKLITCKIMKEDNPEVFAKSIEDAKKTEDVPMASNYQNQLTAIDPNLSQEFYPINKAMTHAIEIVMTHFRYTDPMLGKDLKAS